MSNNNFISHKKAAPVSGRKPRKRKQKDRPSRPLSAYNYFFKDERIEIANIVLHVERNDENKLISNLSTEQICKLKKDDGKVSFEEMGKVIGRRWHEISPKRLAYYKLLSKGDTERYKSEMKIYHEKLEEIHNKTNMPTTELQYDMYSQNRYTPPPIQHYPIMSTPMSGIYSGDIGHMPPTYMDPNTAYGQMPIMHDYSSNYASYLHPTTEGQFGNASLLPRPDDDTGNYTYGASSYHLSRHPQSSGFPPQHNYSYSSDTGNTTQYPSWTHRNQSQMIETSSYNASYPQEQNNAVTQNKGW